MTLTELRERIWRRLDEQADAPLRYTTALVDEVINDGIQLFYARTGLLIDTTTLTQQSGVLWYDLPDDCIRVLNVRPVSQPSEPLAPVDYRSLDEVVSLNYRSRGVYGDNRWTTSQGPIATHYLPFGLREIGLWPLSSAGEPESSAPDTIFDESFDMDGVETTVTLADTPVGGVGVFMNGVRLVRASPATLPWEYSLSGAIIALGLTPDDGDRVQVRYQTVAAALTLEEDISSGLTLSATPVALAVYHNGVRLKKVASGAVDGEFSISGAVVTLGTAYASGDTVLADWTSSATAHTLGESLAGTKDGSNLDFTIAEAPIGDGALSVSFAGVVLERTTGTPDATQFSASGRFVRLGLAPSSTDTVYADYVRPTVISNDTYTATYVQDAGETSVDDGADEIPLPVDYEQALVEYATGRLLLPAGRGPRIEAATTAMGKFMAAVGAANLRQANLARTYTATGRTLS